MYNSTSHCSTFAENSLLSSARLGLKALAGLALAASASLLMSGVASAAPTQPTPTPPAVKVSLPTANFDTSVPISTVIPEPVTTTLIDSTTTGGLNYVGFQGDFTFDETVVTFSNPPVQNSGLTAGNWNVSGNILPLPSPTPGASATPSTIRTLRVSAFSNDFTPLSGSGTLYLLRMLRVSSTPGASTPLAWAAKPNNFYFIDENLDSHTPLQNNGLITITGPGFTPSPTPTPGTPTPTPTATVTPSATPSATHTPTPTPSATHTPTPTPSATHTPTPTPSATHTPTPTPTPSATATASPTATATATATAFGTPSATPTGTPFPTPTPTFEGNFVIGDQNAVVGNHVTFWGARWASVNSLSGGEAPHSFKGFASSTSPNPPTCGGTWTSGTGNSSQPPSSLPHFITVIAASSITQSGGTISGNIPMLVVIQTDPGYQPNPGHPGTGTVVAVTCTSTTLTNISTRLRVETADNMLIGGFIITGTQEKNVLVRAIGPSLSLSDRLADPILELHDSSGQTIATNDNWTDAPNRQAIIDTTIPPSNNLESAILMSLPPGSYTATVRGANNTTGIALVEMYDLDRSVNSRLMNISTRGLVQTSDNVLIAGMIMLGQTPQTVLVRAIGPSLDLPGKLANPTLELRDGNGVLIRSNDNWRSDQEAEIMATTIPPSNDQESAIVATLPANGATYTAVVRGVNGTTGVAVVEVYELN